LRAQKTSLKELQMAQTRIYLVGTPNGVRLVRATVRQQALSHAANQLLTVRVATQDDLVNAMEMGIKIENYKAPEQSDLDLA
jgi:hypothetical protein